MENIPAIKVNNITKVFHLSRKQMKTNKTGENTLVAVNGLSFVVNRGEIYGLLGSNGAGKTTTLRIISTLIKPTSGNVEIDGLDTSSKGEEVRNKIAFLTSELRLEDFFTPDYLFDFYGNLHGLTKEEIVVRKESLFSTFGINEFRFTKVGQLSTGMKQKASLAISLVHNPDIIIFDEPTNGLDVLTAKVVTDFLIQQKEQNKAIIVSTHIFSLIEKVADRVGIIVDGKMAKEGKIDDICGEKSLEDAFFDIYRMNTKEL